MRVLLIVLALLGMATANGQTCLNDGGATTPNEAFAVLESGDLIHLETGLVWQPCSLGQRWSGDTCEGEPELMNWASALSQALRISGEQLLPWRVPNVKELASLVERSCARPAINSFFFADTPADDFWTSTPSTSDNSHAWVVAFFTGSSSTKRQQLGAYVRLVRYRTVGEDE